MSRTRIHIDPAGPLPQGLQKHGRQYRARVNGGAWVSFGSEYPDAINAFRKWRGGGMGVQLDYAAIATELHRSVRKNGRARGITVELTRDQLRELLHRARGRCEVTGIGFSDDKPRGARIRLWYPSVDRIEASKGYVASNCRIVCAYVNLVLNEFGDVHFGRLARAFVQRRGARTLADPAENRPDAGETYSQLPPSDAATT